MACMSAVADHRSTVGRSGCEAYSRSLTSPLCVPVPDWDTRSLSQRSSGSPMARRVAAKESLARALVVFVRDG
jgi:hypothetical protein